MTVSQDNISRRQSSQWKSLAHKRAGLFCIVREPRAAGQRSGITSTGWNIVVGDSFIKSPQSFRSVESGSTMSEQDFYMAKYAIGDVVKKNSSRSGVVRAIFKTLAGELCYAVEHEGALDFVEEAKLSPSTKTDLAA